MKDAFKYCRINFKFSKNQLSGTSSVTIEDIHRWLNYHRGYLAEVDKHIAKGRETEKNREREKEKERERERETEENHEEK